MKIAKYLIPVSWTLWGVVFLVVSWGFVMSLLGEDHSPEVSSFHTAKSAPWTIRVE